MNISYIWFYFNLSIILCSTAQFGTGFKSPASVQTFHYHCRLRHLYSTRLLTILCLSKLVYCQWKACVISCDWRDAIGLSVIWILHYYHSNTCSVAMKVSWQLQIGILRPSNCKKILLYNVCMCISLWNKLKLQSSITPKIVYRFDVFNLPGLSRKR